MKVTPCIFLNISICIILILRSVAPSLAEFTILIKEKYKPLFTDDRLTIVVNISASFHCLCIKENNKLAISAIYIWVLIPSGLSE